MSIPASHEILLFLSDPNPQARQVAMANIVGFSAQGSPFRSLLLNKLTDSEGKPLRTWDGAELDVLERIKELCRDQPVGSQYHTYTAHDARRAKRFDQPYRQPDGGAPCRRSGVFAVLGSLHRRTFFLLTQDSVSLMADLACMLLSNLTKFEPVCARLLDLVVEDRPFYSFLSPLDLQLSLSGMDADPNDKDYEERKRISAEATERLSRSVRVSEAVKLPALLKLMRAFEEGASVESSSASASNMRQHVEDTKRDAGERPVDMDAEGRPRVRRKANCNFLASVFANATVLPRGREFFVQPVEHGDKSSTDAYPVGRLMVYTEHADLIRRGGVISALKNILFIKHAHKMLLAPAPTMEEYESVHAPVDILPYLLMPLIDGKELSKVDLEDQEALPTVCQLVPEDKPRERDPALRMMLIECLLLLCTSYYGRECLRNRGVYIVVREAHLAEGREEVCGTTDVDYRSNFATRQPSEA